MGDWYNAPDFSYDSGAVILYILEQVARDGNAAISLPFATAVAFNIR